MTTITRLFLLAGLALVMYPACLYFHELLHTLVARAKGWVFWVEFTPLGPLQGAERFATTYCEIPPDASKLDLFLFVAPPRMFDTGVLPLLVLLLRCDLPLPVRFIVQALFICWSIDLALSTARIFFSEKPAADAWGTFRTLESLLPIWTFKLVSIFSLLAQAFMVWVVFI